MSIPILPKPDFCSCEKPEFSTNGMPDNICQKCGKEINISRLYKLDLDHLKIKVLKPKHFNKWRYKWLRLLIKLHIKKDTALFITMNDIIASNFQVAGKLKDLEEVKEND